MRRKKSTLLKDTLPLVTIGNTFDPGVTDELPRRAGGFSFYILAPREVTWKVTPQRAKASDIAKLQAYKFVDLLKSGVKPGEAAHRLHTSVKTIMSNPQSQKVVKEVIEEFTYNAEVRKLLQRALVNKTAVENAGEKGDKKLLLDALKLMADDSELGIKGPSVMIGGPVISSALQDVLDKIEPPQDIIDAPALPAPAEASTEEPQP
jgi:hypothetical protein